MAEHLVVLHYHFRPGGVRRVIELALPAIAREMGLRAVTLASGEKAPAAWLDALAKRMRGVELREFVEPAFRYTSEQRRGIPRARLVRSVARLTSDADALWVHNPSLARNVPLVEAVNASGVHAVFHHHDLWVDNRWERWPELRAQGYRSLAHVARVVFPASAFHATINRLDEGVIRGASNLRTGWLPNPAGTGKPVPRNAARIAKKWMAEQLGDDAPVWIFPTRFLRRKNLAEAVLLARWLRPEAWVVTTAAVSSKDEADYARRLQSAAKREKWRAKFALLADAPPGAPDVSALVAASEAVMMTSVQEGFGLPCIEAVAAGKPLIARRLPNVAPDLRRLGFRLPYLYDDVWIDGSLFDAVAERKRQERIFSRWRRKLPAGMRAFAAEPAVSVPLAFSRLTLAAQLEVLAQPPEPAWSACRKWNPKLAEIAAAAAGGNLQAEPWPAAADARLDVDAYAKAFRRALLSKPRGAEDGADAVQRAFIEQRLGSDFVFPILIE